MEGKGAKFMETEGDLTLGSEHTMPHTEDVSQKLYT